MALDWQQGAPPHDGRQYLVSFKPLNKEDTEERLTCVRWLGEFWSNARLADGTHATVEEVRITNFVFVELPRPINFLPSNKGKRYASKRSDAAKST